MQRFNSKRFAYHSRNFSSLHPANYVNFSVWNAFSGIHQMQEQKNKKQHKFIMHIYFMFINCWIYIGLSAFTLHYRLTWLARAPKCLVPDAFTFAQTCFCFFVCLLRRKFFHNFIYISVVLFFFSIRVVYFTTLRQHTTPASISTVRADIIVVSENGLICWLHRQFCLLSLCRAAI